MNDTFNIRGPAEYEAILRDSKEMNFGMPSDLQTGALLRTLAASKPNGSFLEIGTGTGLGTAWLLDGMDAHSTLISIETNAEYQIIAKRHLGHDARLTLLEEDGLAFLQRCDVGAFDLIYADAIPGKYIGFEYSLRCLRRGGILLFDDMLPQPNWPDDHPPKVEALLQTIDELDPAAFSVVKLCWYTGHIIITKK